MGMKATLSLLAVCVLLGTGNGVLVGYLTIGTERGAVAQPEPDEDEQICVDTAAAIYDRSYPDLAQEKAMADLYLKCMESRREARRYQTDSLEAEYLEKLQTCNERAQEAYDSWMACAYPRMVELEEDAHAHNDQRGESDGGEM